MLANVLESEQFHIPRYPGDRVCIEMTNKLLDQLLGFRRKVTNAGNETLESKATHDDIAMATAMAVKEAAKMKGMSCVGMSKN